MAYEKGRLNYYSGGALFGETQLRLLILKCYKEVHGGKFNEFLSMSTTPELVKNSIDRSNVNLDALEQRLMNNVLPDLDADDMKMNIAYLRVDLAKLCYASKRRSPHEWVYLAEQNSHVAAAIGYLLRGPKQPLSELSAEDLWIIVEVLLKRLQNTDVRLRSDYFDCLTSLIWYRWHVKDRNPEWDLQRAYTVANEWAQRFSEDPYAHLYLCVFSLVSYLESNEPHKADYKHTLQQSLAKLEYFKNSHEVPRSGLDQFFIGNEQGLRAVLPAGIVQKLSQDPEQARSLFWKDKPNELLRPFYGNLSSGKWVHFEDGLQAHITSLEKDEIDFKQGHTVKFWIKLRIDGMNAVYCKEEISTDEEPQVIFSRFDFD